MFPRCIKQNTKFIYSKGSGSWVYTRNRTFLDLTSGIGVLSLGHRHSRICNTLCSQILGSGIHFQIFNGTIDKYSILCELLKKKTPKNIDTFVFSTSGSEAVGNAIKVARQYTKRKKILSIRKGFHGRAIGVAALSDTHKWKKDMGPLLGDCLVSNDINNIDSDVAAVIIESIQGESGVTTLSNSFMQQLRHKTHHNGSLLITDEIQCGINRTGSFFDFEYSKIIPDIILAGKGLANGIPIGCMMSNSKFFENSPPGSIGGTFAGNPLQIVAAIETLKVMEEEKIKFNVIIKSQYFRFELNELKKRFSCIKKIKGRGFMIGIEMDKEVELLLLLCYEQGLLVLPTSDKYVIRMLPSLNIEYTELNTALDMFQAALVKFENTTQLLQL